MPLDPPKHTRPAPVFAVALSLSFPVLASIRTASAQGDGVEPLVLSGQSVPELGEDAVILGFGPYDQFPVPSNMGYGVRVLLAEDGSIASTVLLNEPYGGGLDHAGILTRTESGLAFPALPGGSPPLVDPGLTYRSAEPEAFDDSGRLWWRGELQGPGVITADDTLGFVSNEIAVWLPDESGGLRLFREGQRVPAQPGNIRLQDPEVMVVNGRPLLRHLLGDRLDPDLIVSMRDEQRWTLNRVQPQGLGPIFSVGDGVDDSPEGDITSGFYFVNGVDASDTVFVSAADHPPLAFIFRRDGEPAAPLEGVSYEWLAIHGDFPQAGSMVIDDDGISAFSAEAIFIGTRHDRGVWLRESPTHYSLLLREGDELPSADGPVVMEQASPVAVAPDGLVILAARFEPVSAYGVWSYHPEEGFREIFREGGSYGWLPDDADSIRTLRGISFGASGEVHFRFDLEGEGLGLNNRFVRAVADRFGGVHLLSRGKAPFQVAPGDVRTVVMPSSHSPAAESVNESGQVAFWTAFQGGSEGLFLADTRVLGRCHAADLAIPSGVLNFDDVLAYVVAFGEGRRRADLAPPLGELDFDDILAFLGAFGACD